MAADPVLLEQLSDVLGALGHVTSRRMFSGAGVYVDGVIVSIVRGDGSVYFKVDDLTRPIFVEAGASPFTYARKTGTKSLHSYWSLPVDPFDDPDDVLAYARLALAASRRARLVEAQSAKPKKAGTNVKPLLPQRSRALTRKR